MKCEYCGKKIWFWQKCQSLGGISKQRHFHYDCLFHKMFCRLKDAANARRINKCGDPIELLFNAIDGI